MTNILKAHREQFAKQFSAEIFDPKIAAAIKSMKESGLGMRLYRLFVTEEQEESMRGMPESITGSHNTVRFNPKQFGYVEFVSVEIGPKKTYPFCRSIGLDLSNMSEFCFSSEIDYLSRHKDGHISVKGLGLSKIRALQKIAKEARALYKAIDKVKNDKESFKSEIETQLANVRTLKSLKKLWPECYDDFTRITGLSESSGRSLALPVANLNNIIESHRREQERNEEAA